MCATSPLICGHTTYFITVGSTAQIPAALKPLMAVAADAALYASSKNRIIRPSPTIKAGFARIQDVLHCSVPSKPPWLLKRLQIDFSMHASCKESTPREIFRAKYYEICDQYQDYCKLYTDGSMSGDQVGSATICGTTTKTVRLPNGVSIFRAELYAITMALNIIYHRKENYFIIFSDSMSSLQAGVSQFCLREWQDIWNCCEGNKLHAIYPNVGRIPHCKAVLFVC